MKTLVMQEKKAYRFLVTKTRANIVMQENKTLSLFRETFSLKLMKTLVIEKKH